MLIQQLFSWPTLNWPAAVVATQYTVFQLYPTPVVALQNTSTNSVLLTFDDTLQYVFQVRPSIGSLPTPTSVGPEVTTFVVGYMPCRAWLRQKVRMAVADRADATGNTTLLFPDDELNQWIQEAFGELNVTFPVERSTTIALLPPTIDTHGNQVGTRTYALPTDFLLMDTVEFVLQDGHLHLYLKEKPWKGGESTATSYLAYPKLGILISPQQGRFFPGHFQIAQDQLQIDWDPPGSGEYLNVSYEGRRTFPIDDATPFDDVTPEDMELLSLHTQMKCWLRIEGNDTRLSRWRGNPDGANRDGMPTVKHSMIIKQLYDQRVNDRRETRPRVLRLVRR
jgi:hypothetical protein